MYSTILFLKQMFLMNFIFKYVELNSEIYFGYIIFCV